MDWPLAWATWRSLVTLTEADFVLFLFLKAIRREAVLIRQQGWKPYRSERGALEFMAGSLTGLLSTRVHPRDAELTRMPELEKPLRNLSITVLGWRTRIS